MIADEFLDLVATDLRRRHVPFDRREVREFFDGMWPLVSPGDLPGRWADASLEAAGSEPGLHELHGRPAEALYALVGRQPSIDR
jgi:hypothetical protein